MSGQIWQVPYDSLQGIPRVGETIRFGGISSGNVAQVVEYEFAPVAAPVEPARELPADAAYALCDQDIVPRLALLDGSKDRRRLDPSGFGHSGPTTFYIRPCPRWRKRFLAGLNLLTTTA